MKVFAIFILILTNVTPCQVTVHFRIASCVFAMTKTTEFLLLEIGEDADTGDLEKNHFRGRFKDTRYLLDLCLQCSSDGKLFQVSLQFVLSNFEMMFGHLMIAFIIHLIQIGMTLIWPCLTNFDICFVWTLNGSAQHTFQIAQALPVSLELQNFLNLIKSPPSNRVPPIFPQTSPLNFVFLLASTIMEVPSPALQFVHFHLKSPIRAFSFTFQTADDDYQFVTIISCQNRLKDGLIDPIDCYSGQSIAFPLRHPYFHSGSYNSHDYYMTLNSAFLIFQMILYSIVNKLIPRKLIQILIWFQNYQI